MEMTMRNYIDEQPSVLQDLLDRRSEYTCKLKRDWKQYQPDRLYLIGSGSSYNAIAAATPFMERVLGMEVNAHVPSALPVIRAKRPMVWFVSQGGHSTNTLYAMEKLKDIPGIAIAGTEDCQMRCIAEHFTLLPCGAENVGPKTKGYLSTIIFLYTAAMQIALENGLISAQEELEIAGELYESVAYMKQNIVLSEAWVEKNADVLTHMPHYVVVGKGQAGIVAKEGALKLVETVLKPASYYEFEEFLHGPISDINGMLAGIYMLPHRNDPDYERMLKVARVHAEESDAVCIVGVCGEEGEDILGLKTGKAWYTEPLAHILVCQLIGSNLPERMNVGERSKNIFERIDRMVDVKYGHKA